MPTSSIRPVRLSLFVVLFALLVAASFQSLADPTEPANSRVVATNEAFASELAKKQWSASELRRLLTQRNYQELERIFVGLSNNFYKDPSYEGAWVRSALGFENMADRSGSEEALLHLYDEWVEESDSYVALAARAHFLLGLALNSRGTRFVSETSKEDMEGMRTYRAAAQPEFHRVLEIQPDYLPAYFSLMKSAKLVGNDSVEVSMLTKGLKYAPGSFWLRSMRMDSLQPWWGGSFEEMDEFSNSFIGVEKDYPRVWSLHGMPAAARARTASRNQDYAGAIHHLGVALSYGDRLFYLKDRAFYNYYLGNKQAAIEDLERIASYGVGEAAVEYLISVIKKEEAEGDSQQQSLSWRSFRFPT